MRGGQVRTFIVILGITFLVWVAVAMSESREYTLPLRVTYTGFDAKRYAVVRTDTVLTVQVRSTGFNAMFLSLRGEPTRVTLDIHHEAVHRYARQEGGKTELYRTTAVADLSTLIGEQLTPHGMQFEGSGKDSLQLVLVERSSRRYVPDLRALRVNFSDGYGLYGQPTVTPSEITLYGPRGVLDSIEGIGVVETELNEVQESGTYVLRLDEKWKQRGDIFASADKLTITIPVRRFVERRFTVPVVVEGGDSALVNGLRLYPERVELDVWVSQEDMSSVTEDRFEVVASYADILSGEQKLKLRVSRFPQSVRIRSVSPEEIAYVIIK